MNNNKKFSQTDLEESQRDKKELEPEEFSINLPDVEDIPGQENIHPPKMKAMEDVTISSADEEGESIFNDEDSDESNVSDTEKAMLEKSANSMGSEDDETIEKIQLDKTDNDGEVLNENDDLFGKDLDVPGAEADDENEDIGEEDEENNSYSWAQ